MKIIPDSEIDLNNNDLLETKKYVDTLKNIVKDTNSSTTIGLFGEWGSGKSSILHTLEKNLLEDSKDNSIRFIKYDAWKYSGDSFRRTFIDAAYKQLEVKKPRELDNFYKDNLNETENKKFYFSLLFKYLSLVSFFLILFFIVFKLFGLEFKKDEITLAFLLSLVGMVITNSKHTEKDIIHEHKYFAPEQFEKLLDELLSKNKEKIIIVIDNIDRCNGELAYELLTTIKTFISEQNNITLLIPIDDKALVRHLELNSKDNEGNEFIRKIFNLNIKIKRFQPTDLFPYTEKLNEKYNLDLDNTTLDIISKEYASNPRRIIQILNNLMAELELLKNKIDENFIIKNESIIAILLIIKEEYLELFEKICYSPHILYNESLKSSSSDLHSFITTVTNVINRTAILDIEKILLNNENDSLIPNNLKMDILKHELITEDNVKKIIDYYIEEIRKESNRGNREVSGFNLFIKILELNYKYRLQDYQLQKLASSLVNSSHQYMTLVNSDKQLEMFNDFIKRNNSFKIFNYNIVYEKFIKDFWSSYSQSKEYTFFERQSFQNYINNIKDEPLSDAEESKFENFYYFIGLLSNYEKKIDTSKICSYYLINLIKKKHGKSLHNYQNENLYLIDNMRFIKEENLGYLYSNFITVADTFINQGSYLEVVTKFMKNIVKIIKISLYNEKCFSNIYLDNNLDFYYIDDKELTLEFLICNYFLATNNEKIFNQIKFLNIKTSVESLVRMLSIEGKSNYDISSDDDKIFVKYVKSDDVLTL